MKKEYFFATTVQGEKYKTYFEFHHPLPLKKWNETDWQEYMAECKKQAKGPAVPLFLQQIKKGFDKCGE